MCERIGQQTQLRWKSKHRARRTRQPLARPEHEREQAHRL